MAEVGIIRAGDVAGIWVGCDRGVVGLVAVEHVGLHIVVYPPGTPLPDAARAGDPSGQPPIDGAMLVPVDRLASLVPPTDPQP